MDPHIQAFPDFDHFMDLGLVTRLFAFITNSLTNAQKEEIETRLTCLTLPRGWNKINLNLHSSSKKLKPMTYMRKLCVLGLYLFQGFIEAPIRSLLVNLLHLRGMILDPYQNGETIQKVSYMLLNLCLCNFTVFFLVPHALLQKYFSNVTFSSPHKYFVFAI